MLSFANAHFVLYASERDGRLRVMVTDSDDLEQFRRQHGELGKPIAAFRAVFEGADAKEHRVLFDMLCQMASITECATLSFLEALFLSGFQAGRAHPAPKRSKRP